MEAPAGMRDDHARSGGSSSNGGGGRRHAASSPLATGAATAPRPCVLPPTSPLPGGPDQPFHLRLSRLNAQSSLRRYVLLLGMHLAFVFRNWDSILAPSIAWQLSHYACYAGLIAWRLLAPASFEGLREPCVAFLRLTSLGLGVGMRHVFELMNSGPAAELLSAAEAAEGVAVGAAEHQARALGLGPAADGAAQLARLLFASCSVSLLMAAVALRMRPSLSAAAQLGLVLSLLPHTRRGCSGAVLGHPAAARSTHSVYGALSWVGAMQPLPLAPLARPSPADECTTIITFLHLGLGLVVPLLWEWLSVSRLFSEHERQRRRAGLPCERGLHAAAYRMLWAACGGVEGAGAALPPLLLGWMLLAATWDWTAYLVAGKTVAD
ncbi:hypothetical protein ABPG75_002259 [Micractinium tetrahymenae]